MPGEDIHQQWVPSFNPWLVAVSVMLATVMEILDTSVANVALPHIAGNLSATTEEATWVLTSYLISNAIILPATSWISRYIGRKRFLIICIGLFTLASALCGAAPSLAILIIARVLQGMGGGALQPIAQAVLLESFPPEKRGAAMALYGMGIVVAPIIGPTLGGWITDNYSWRWIFYINLPIGALAAFMANSFVEDPPYLKNEKPGKIDYTGFGLMALGLGALELTLDLGEQRDWFESSLICFTAAVSALSLLSFVIWEIYTPEPIVNLRVFLNRNFAVACGMIATVGTVLYATTALLPLFLQTLLGYPAVLSGEAVSPRGIGAIISMVFVGRLIPKVDTRYLILFGFGLLSYSIYLFTGLSLDISMSSIVIPMIVSGFALGFVFVPLTTLSVATLPQRDIGNATGVYNLMRNTGGSIGIAVMTTLLVRSQQVHLSVLTEHANQYNPAFQQAVAAIQKALGGGSGPGTDASHAYALIYQLIARQAAVLAYNDVFWILTVLSALCVPAVILFKKVRNARPVAGAH
ncbi:MAG: DHA2 family efflux MFS transporter permease subunit [Pyrinomonadaceae bacterium]